MGVSEPEEMEYSTSRDIGQTRSRSAKMMGECPLETRRRPGRRFCCGGDDGVAHMADGQVGTSA